MEAGRRRLPVVVVVAGRLALIESELSVVLHVPFDGASLPLLLHHRSAPMPELFPPSPALLGWWVP